MIKERNMQVLFRLIILDLLFGLIVFGLLFFSLSSAQGALTNECGETWIKWSWDFDNTTVYVDGLLVVNDSDIGYYVLSDLRANEKHTITLVDNDILPPNQFEQEAETKPQMLVGNTIYLLIFAIVFIIIGMKMPLFCLLGMTLAFYGGIVNANATTEGWIVITYFLVGFFALIEMAMELMEK